VLLRHVSCMGRSSPPAGESFQAGVLLATFDADGVVLSRVVSRLPCGQTDLGKNAPPLHALRSCELKRYTAFVEHQPENSRRLAARIFPWT
jgi:hypothetical protein